MTEERTVADLMTSSPATVLPDENVAQVYDLMNDRSIRHVPVVDADGNLEGLVSHRDLVRSVLFAFDELPYSEQRESLKTMRVREVMTTDPETVEPETAVIDAARILLENKFGCLPVVAGTHLVGILTEADFVKHVVDEDETSAQHRVEKEQVDQYATSSPQKVERRTPVPKVAELMRQGGFRHMPVVENGRVVGVISERILHMMANISGIDLVTAADVMTKNPYTVESGTSLLRVASDMASRRVGSAIVVRSGEPVGIFTATDALQALIKMLGNQTAEETVEAAGFQPEAPSIH